MSRDDAALARIPYDELGAIGEHLLVCRDRDLSARTVHERHRRLLTMQNRIGKPLETAPESDVRSWWRSLSRNSNLIPASRACYLSHARAFYKWCIRENLRDNDPTLRIDAPRRHKRLPRDVDPARAAAAVEAMKGKAHIAAALALYCAMRRKEISEVRGTDVIRRAVGPVLRVHGKGGTERIVPLPGWLAQEIRAVGDGWVFASTRAAAGHWTPDHVGDVIARGLREHGLDATTHQLRHTSANLLLERTGDIEQVRIWLGHENLAATQIYARHQGVDRAVVLDLFTGIAARAQPDGLVDVSRELPFDDQDQKPP